MDGWVSAVITSLVTFIVWVGIFLYKMGHLEGKVDEISRRLNHLEHRVNNIGRP